jgi:hypothetical protein
MLVGISCRVVSQDPMLLQVGPDSATAVPFGDYLAESPAALLIILSSVLLLNRIFTDGAGFLSSS